MTILDASVLPILSTIAVPNTPMSLADISHQRGDTLVVTMGVPIAKQAEALAREFEQALLAKGVTCKVTVEQDIAAITEQRATQQIAGVKHIIAVASGKGGVGKSTTAVNLALALAHEGARVGILDADIYGPSQPLMLGVNGQRPGVENQNTFIPLAAHGIQMMSMGALVTDKTPMVWRGPMASGALNQMIKQTRWQEVDYLVVDMPPGTGDIQLTLSQSVPVSTSVIVTTPQDIALLDAKKGIEMFRKVNIPVAGIVENMSTHRCSQCGHEEAIFGEHGGERLAEDFETQLLGRLPLTMAIRLQTDVGEPTVAKDPEAPESLVYREIARKVAASIWVQSVVGDGAPVIEIADDE